MGAKKAYVFCANFGMSAPFDPKFNLKKTVKFVVTAAFVFLQQTKEKNRSFVTGDLHNTSRSESSLFFCHGIQGIFLRLKNL